MLGLESDDLFLDSLDLVGKESLELGHFVLELFATLNQCFIVLFNSLSQEDIVFFLLEVI